MSRSTTGAGGLPTDVGKHALGGGLYVQIRDSEQGVRTQSWLYRYKLNGKATEMGLGSVSKVSEKEARLEVERWRAWHLAGHDPRTVRDEHKEAVAKREGRRLSFEQVADECVPAQAKLKNWADRRGIDVWIGSFRKHVYCQLKNKSISDITPRDVVKDVLTPIWHDIPDTAERVRNRMETVFDYAINKGWRTAPNPARWKGLIDKELPRLVKGDAHFNALYWKDIHSLYSELQAREGISARALEFLILTVARSGSVRLAQWKEINFKDQSWRIPAEHMKGKKVFRTPLSKAALDVLERVKPENYAPDDIIFPNQKTGRPLCDVMLSKLMRVICYDEETKALKYADFDTHGCPVPHAIRSTFRDYFGETQPYPREVVEEHLSHEVGNKVERAYRRGSFFEIRRVIAETWAEACIIGPKPFDISVYLQGLAKH